MTDEFGLARLILYGRSYCHLCDDMLAAAEALRGEFRFEIEVRDIDSEPTLVDRYHDLVPVLEAEGIELCHYHFDEAKVREYLGRFR